MLEKVRNLLRRDVEPVAAVVVAQEPLGPETAQEVIDRVTDPRARVVVREEGLGTELDPAAQFAPTPTETAASGLPRFAVAVLSIAAILVGLRQLQGFAAFVAPAFFALNLMITAYPLKRLLSRAGVPDWLGSLVAGLAVLLALSLMLFGLVYAVSAMVAELPKYETQFTSIYEQTVALATRYFNLDESQLLDKLKGIDPSSLMSVVTGLLSNAQGVASLLIVLVTTLIFMVMDSADIEKRLEAAASTHPRVVDGLSSFAQGIRKYWLVTTLFGLIVAVLDYGILLGIGVPLSLTWALFSFLTNYIPNVGFVIGVVPPALLALVDQDWQAALMVVVLYTVVNFAVQSIIQPRVAGDAVGLTPTLSFLSLLLWSYVLGAMGALVALPASLLVKALLVDVDPRARWTNTLISSRISDGDPIGTGESRAV